jgi:hypothetical protein
MIVAGWDKKLGGQVRSMVYTIRSVIVIYNRSF